MTEAKLRLIEQNIRKELKAQGINVATPTPSAHAAHKSAAQAAGLQMMSKDVGK